MGIRIICVDRPGMGGATRVPLKIRMEVWLEIVPVLLQKAGVQHVHIITHSAGTMYSMNTLYHLRDYLYPQTPYIAFLGPWVYQSHSKMTLWNTASKIPASIIGHWNDVNKFINTRVMPSIGWSGGVLSSITNLFRAEPGGAKDSGATDAAERYGVDAEVAKHISKLVTKFFLAEDTSAANEEALLCLKKHGPGCWGICEDYEEYVRLLIKAEKDRRPAARAKKLRVEVYFAESDLMIGDAGDKGQTYFDNCWKQAEGLSDVIDYESQVLPETNHETVLADFKKGALKRIFESIMGLHQ
jgi:pimeloyl-ACP methyl ester carboxylesterase